YFSRYCHVWGWATWRRAWRYYDVAMSDWPTVRTSRWLRELLDDSGQVKRWSRTFDIMHSGGIDTWDVQWMYACWRQHGLSIVPNVNLVTNIGFRADATHTKAETDRFAVLPVKSVAFPLIHPPQAGRDMEADRYTERHVFHVPWPERARRGLQKATRWILKQGRRYQTSEAMGSSDRSCVP
ncbi:MAG: hypothetical protein ACOYNP_13690, partial [Gemmataceae bacterium]